MPDQIEPPESAPWYTPDSSRRRAMTVLVLLGISPWMMQDHYELLYAWVLLPFISPRFIAGLAYGLGACIGFLRGNR